MCWVRSSRSARSSSCLSRRQMSADDLVQRRCDVCTSPSPRYGDDIEGRCMKAQIQGSIADTGKPMDFDEAFRARLRDLLVWRRDVRRFRRDPLPSGTLERLIQLACLAPSVGLSQPWRFVIVDDPAHRAAIRTNFESCNAAALAAQNQQRAAAYARLMFAGLDDAPSHLAARAEGIGMGWVSILEPAAVAAILDVPANWKFIAYLCLGFPQAEDDIPELERAGWEQRQAPSSVVIRR